MQIDTEPKLPRLVGIAAVMQATSLSRASVYRRIEAGELKPIKIGRRTLFSEAHIAHWLKSKVEQAA